MSDEEFKRILPVVTDLNRHFWSGGEDGHLHILKCSSCANLIHPPLPLCNQCRSRDLVVSSVSGMATVVSFTINHQPWFPGLTVPYSVAIVELTEQPGLRITTNIINCNPDDIRIGMPVRVTFQPLDDVWLPLFEPAHSSKPSEENNNELY